MQPEVGPFRITSQWALWLAALVSWFFAGGFLLQRIPAGLFAEDFSPSFWDPWHDVRSGVSPYPEPSDPLSEGSPFLYPPLAAEVTLPFSWLPFDLAYAILAVALLAAAGLTLWALDVRRRDVWAVWMLSPAILGPTIGGNITPVVVLGVALAWRWRDREMRAAAALTAALVLKPFVWPVLLWFVFTGRHRAAAYTAVASSALVLGSWAAIGFDGLLDYPAILHETGERLGPNGFLAYALAAKVVSGPIALWITVEIAIALLAAAFILRRDDTASLTLAIVACLYATPILWLHYFGLLIIPAALYGGWLWGTIPLLLLSKLAPVGQPRPAWMILCFIAATAIVVARALLGARSLAEAERGGAHRRLGQARESRA